MKKLEMKKLNYGKISQIVINYITFKSKNKIL